MGAGGGPHEPWRHALKRKDVLPGVAERIRRCRFEGTFLERNKSWSQYMSQFGSQIFTVTDG